MEQIYNVILNENDLSDYDDDYILKQADLKAIVQKNTKNGVIDGDAIINEIFNSKPDYDIFISYSHKDQKLAKRLANFLDQEFGLFVFLDCDFWQSSDDLLKEIDNKYCLNEDKKTYDYKKRNFSTSHIHAMLSASIVKTIASSKVCFFLNTKNSISSLDSTIVKKTLSPWIFEEITVAKYLINNTNKKNRVLLEDAKELAVDYTLPLNGSQILNSSSLNFWLNKYRNNSKKALDILFSLHFHTT